ncbi:acyltransferase family protein [Hafnia alvei]|uniref:acyltransferase family protein n=1 Tax=Hafnia alvei TaxID=569 RepID=UPI000E1B616C|nr:acyltransferase [Hafnia alvei]
MFIISGFIIALSTRNYSGATDFAIKRIFRIYPVLIFSLILFWLVSISPELFLFIKSAIPLHRDYNLDAPFFGYNVLLPAWTLTYEIYFYFIFMVSMAISHKYRTSICSLLIIASVCGLQYIYNGSIGMSGKDVAQVNSFGLPFSFLKLMSSPMLIEFVYGMLLYELRGILKKIPCVNMVFFACVVFYVCCFFSTYRYFYGPLNFGMWAFVLIFGALAYESQRGIKESKTLSFLGDISFSLYMTHVIVIHFFRNYWPDAPIYGMGPGVVRVIFIAGISIVLSYVVFNLIEKPLIKIGRSLISRIDSRRS